MLIYKRIFSNKRLLELWVWVTGYKSGEQKLFVQRVMQKFQVVESRRIQDSQRWITSERS